MSKVKAHVGRQGRVSELFPFSQPGHGVWACRAIWQALGVPSYLGCAPLVPAQPGGSAPSLPWGLSIQSGLCVRRGLMGIMFCEDGFGL